MTITDETEGVVPGRTRRLVGVGLIATLGAMAATTLGAALARAAGVDFELPDGGETIPPAGFAVLTGICCGLGVLIAVGLLRWSSRPARRFLWTAVSLTVLSLVAPFVLTGANAATMAALAGLHLVAAAVMIPALTWSLRTRGQSISRTRSGS
ncbi:hypothetical protein BJY16_005780 [Actinoplanes octamycinicus]|uniref:Uncharacterized protein n=1 Tax=Actinoplanes octamycinicus TaxID=135948 RepID=A0A7W7M9X2_9ACTN|nr:DUF6069 family protein [Actinoplanes octamycinicus]MBB4742321.1 hypothetical protein [Actinoplanes octamycinicus]GIE59835.1 hypothetical protein Aoc01nite_52370 [Actinoplanes octamycinicus]